jgi:hypothetical protein
VPSAHRNLTRVRESVTLVNEYDVRPVRHSVAD